MKKLNIIIVADNSSGNRAMRQQLELKLYRLYSAINEHSIGVDDVDVNTTLFVSGQKAPLYEQMPLNKKDIFPVKIKAADKTDYIKTISDALEYGGKQYRWSRMNNEDVLRPCYVFLTDAGFAYGSPKDNDEQLKKILENIYNGERYKKFNFYAVALLDDKKHYDMDLINSFSCFEDRIFMFEDAKEGQEADFNEFVRTLLIESGVGGYYIVNYDGFDFGETLTAEDPPQINTAPESVPECFKGVLKFLGTGVNHENNRIPCQDCAEYYFAENGNVIMAVSDGCSSSLYAKEAAQANVAAIINLFSKVKLKDFINITEYDNINGIIIESCRRKLKKLAQLKPIRSIKDVCATLIFAVSDGEQVLVGHLGDGLICGIDSNGEISYISDPDNGESTTQTVFTASQNAIEALRVRVIDAAKIKQLLLCSDGPYSMFKAFGKEKPEAVVQQLLGAVGNGSFKSNIDFCKWALGVHVSVQERMDDWSILIADTKNEYREEKIEFPLSMSKK